MITAPEAGRLDAGRKRLWDLYQAKQFAQLLTEAEQQAKAAGGDPPPALLGLVAMGFLGLEQTEDALRTARMATAQPPAEAWLCLVLAEAEFAAAGRASGQAASGRTQHLAAAITAARAANRMLPGQPEHLAALSRYLRAAGDLDAARASARQAADAGPAQVCGYLELGLCQAAGGQPEEALTAFRRAQSLAPADARAFLEEGRLHLAQAQIAASRAALRRALVIDPGLDAAEDLLVASISGPRQPAGRVLHLAVGLARLNLLGLTILAFLYYVAYRLLQMLGWVLPSTWPVARGVLQFTLAVLVLALASGKVLRWWLRWGPK